MIPPLPVIFMWPLAVFGFFFRMDLPRAICWSIVAGYLLLPSKVRYNLPALPAIDKDSMPSFAIVLALLIFGRSYGARNPGAVRPGLLPRDPLVLGLAVMMVLGGLLTVLTNGDPLRFEIMTIPGLRIYDGFSAMLGAGVTLLPVLLARKYLATEEGHRILLIVLSVSALIYTVPIVYELIMSPQMNIKVYGFFPHSWRQHIRGSGYRPVVFLHHGLWLGIFMCCSVLATLGLTRIVPLRKKAFYVYSGAWLFFILMMSKTLGAFGIALLLAPMVLFLGVRLQLIFAACIAGTVLLYPMLRGANMVPVEHVVSLAEKIDVKRANSLRYRLYNEEILLDKANQRPVFGWGGWGRWRVYDERGRDISTSDGRWIITIGANGWFGYVARFGLLGLPIILMALRRRKYDTGLASSVLALVLAGNLIDLIPNAGLTPVTWLMAGALMGRLELRSSETPSVETPEDSPTRAGPGYSRPRPTKVRGRPDKTTPAQKPHSKYTRTAPRA